MKHMNKLILVSLCIFMFSFASCLPIPWQKLEYKIKFDTELNNYVNSRDFTQCTAIDEVLLKDPAFNHYVINGMLFSLKVYARYLDSNNTGAPFSLALAFWLIESPCPKSDITIKIKKMSLSSSLVTDYRAITPTTKFPLESGPKEVSEFHELSMNDEYYFNYDKNEEVLVRMLVSVKRGSKEEEKKLSFVLVPKVTKGNWIYTGH